MRRRDVFSKKNTFETFRFINGKNIIKKKNALFYDINCMRLAVMLESGTDGRGHTLKIRKRGHILSIYSRSFCSHAMHRVNKHSDKKLHQTQRKKNQSIKRTHTKNRVTANSLEL